MEKNRFGFLPFPPFPVVAGARDRAGNAAFFSRADGHSGTDFRETPPPPSHALMPKERIRRLPVSVPRLRGRRPRPGLIPPPIAVRQI